ncbi:MAG TPA: nucleoside triphosphate pyrophosphatase [Oleiagrimonas sp.]|nr:nucleoside triphosphate pyrophosphatase [Oleiagrimonas sp.]
MTAPVILASTSRYRAQLLHRLLGAFEQVAPDADETPQPGEVPSTRALRLAALKARAVARQHPGALVIGSDQVASLDDEILRKPGDAATAHAQLSRSSAHMVTFHTALCIVDADGHEHMHTDHTRVHFRRLDDATIARYIAAEKPLDCAGSFKCEGLGIALFERIESEDPTALIGLPLIATARLLRESDLTLP